MSDQPDAWMAHYQTIATTLETFYHRRPLAANQSPLDELIATILSQNTNDRNRDVAFNALREHFPNWEAVRDADPDAVINVIRPAGLANQKGPRIQHVLQAISRQHGALDLDFLFDWPPAKSRVWLEKFKGVGPKTAAIVMLFALHQPAFPVDTHVHRVTGRLGLRPADLDPAAAQAFFETRLEGAVSAEDCYSVHLNLIQLGRELCPARRPHCDHCPLTPHCAFAQAAERETS